MTLRLGGSLHLALSLCEQIVIHFKTKGKHERKWQINAAKMPLITGAAANITSHSLL